MNRPRRHSALRQSTSAHARVVPPIPAGSLTKRILSKTWRAIWQSGLFMAALLVTLILMAILNLGTYVLAWTAISPTNDYVTDRWLSMVIPATAGIVVGISIAGRNRKTYRDQTLNGVENLVRSAAGALATSTEVYMGVAAIRWTLESGVQAAKEEIAGGPTIETIQPYLEVGLVETLLLCAGIYATVEITRRACLMQKESARTARAPVESGHGAKNDRP